MVLANEGINLEKKTLDLNIKNNQIVIIDWIINPYTASDFAKCSGNIKYEHLDYDKEAKRIKTFFRNFFNLLIKKKQNTLVLKHN